MPEHLFLDRRETLFLPIGLLEAIAFEEILHSSLEGDAAKFNEADMDKERMIAIAITPIIIGMIYWWRDWRDKKAAKKDESLRLASLAREQGSDDGRKPE